MDEAEIDRIVNNVSGFNNSGNATNEIDSFYFYETEQFTVLGILFVIIIIGNGAVLKTLLCTKSRKSRMNFFICHLAFSVYIGILSYSTTALSTTGVEHKGIWHNGIRYNGAELIKFFFLVISLLGVLFVGLICVLTDIIWRLTVSWNAGNIACKIIKFLQVSVTYASSYVLVALSIDRYDAIRHPMKFSGSWKRAKCLIIAAWILSILFAIPILILYEEKSIKGTLQCWLDFEQPWHWQVYMVLVSVTVFILPAIIITGCYAVIIATIWSKSAIIAVTKNNAKCYLGCDNTRRASSRGLIPRAKVKTVKITLVIVSVFIICWSPYIFFGLFQVFELVPDQSQSLIAIATFIQSLAFLNSAANPIIYCIFSTHLCRILTSISPIKWLFSCQRKIRDDSQTTTSNTQTSSLSEYLTNNTRKSTKSFVRTSTSLTSPNRNVVSFCEH